MKRWVVLFFLFVISISWSQKKVNWMTMNQALEAQKKAPKKIVIDVYTNWCKPCEVLDKYTFQNEYIADYINKNYYAVKFNAEGDDKINYKGKFFLNPNYNPEKGYSRNGMHQYAQYLNIGSYPTVVFMDEKSELLLPLVGVHPPKDMEFYLKIIATEKYKDFSTTEELNSYHRDFVSKITDSN